MRNKIFQTMALLALSLTAASTAAAQEAYKFDRPFDPIVIQGSNFGDFVEKAGRPCIDSMMVMAWRDGEWRVIPFQVDEKKRFMKVGGYKNWLLYRGEPEYVINYDRHGPRKIKDENCWLDEDDELAFMAFDGGDQAPDESRPDGAGEGLEIQLSPAAGEAKAYVYVFFFDKSAAPPLSHRSYIEYDPAKDEVKTRAYIVSYSRRDPLYFDRLAIPSSNGGTGVDLVDGEKYRVRVRLISGFMDYFLTNMDNYGKCFGAKAGPIRVIRRTKTKLEFFMYAGKYHKRDMFYYPANFEYLVDMNHHSPLKEGMYDLTFRLTTDLSPDMQGAQITTDRNPAGAVADGELSEDEKKLDYGPTQWVAVNGPAGRWIQTVQMPESSGNNIWPDFYYLDDTKRTDPPEKFPGQFGNAGFTVAHFSHINKGAQWFRVAYYFPEKISDRSVSDAVNVTQDPVIARIGGAPANERPPFAFMPPDTRSGENAPGPSYVVHKDEIPTRGYFPQIMIDPNLGNGTGLGYVDRDFMGTGIDVDSFFILSDRLFFVGHIILNEWPFLPKSQDLKLWIEYQDHPNRFFFGVGNDTPEDAQTIYHWQQLLAFVSFTQKISDRYGMRASLGFKNTNIGPGKWFSGEGFPSMQERFGYQEDITEERFGATPYGIDGGMSNYLQVAVFRDGRDDWFNPHSGTYEEARLDWVTSMLGADFDFLRIGLEVKGFWTPKLINRGSRYPNNPWVAKFFGIGKDRILAARLAVDRIEAPSVTFMGQKVPDIPFFEQGYIGDSFNNRGYYWARYIDRDRIYLNVEFRTVMWKMWVIVFFYDTGRVFNDILEPDEWQETTWDSYHHTVGIGLRGVFPAQLMMRMDFGFSSEHPNGIVYGNAYHTF